VATQKKMKKPVTPEHEPTEFLNVDLDIEGTRADVDALTAVLDRRFFQLHREDEARKSRVHYEAHGRTDTIERTLRALCGVLEKLPPAARKAWQRAKVRDFNVGIQAGLVPHATEYAIAPATLARLEALGGRLVLTIYAPFPRP
jgi:hypothetical protein